MRGDGWLQTLTMQCMSSQLPSGQGRRRCRPTNPETNPLPGCCLCGHHMWSLGNRAARWLMDWVLEFESLVIKSLLDDCVTKQVLILA